MAEQCANYSSPFRNHGGDAMSTTNLVIGGAVFAGVFQVAILAITPEVPPIQVHDLGYSSGTIHQSRTITTKDDFFPAQWRATIVSVDTGKPVVGCSGSGFWPYKEGHVVADIPLPEWVGSDACTPEYLRSLGGEFKPVASWYWGNDKTSHVGPPFKP